MQLVYDHPVFGAIEPSCEPTAHNSLSNSLPIRLQTRQKLGSDSPFFF